ncbi:protein THEMIS2 [Python bivittatus]|uniref:Protein THEMIS2 n=1 Tax=Python bivittatus TaxID=176946 RepID=A0A9F2R8V5_PYTBI|nr:protein THEMIS2 [Python bivittatus]
MEPVSFHRYISDLNLHSLPRVVKVSSGVYFQGSVYELSGNECCLSTGDLMKIIDVQLQEVICENAKSGHAFVLPPDFKGYFQPSSESPHQRKPSILTSPFSKGKVLGSQEKKNFTLWDVLQSSTMRHKRLKCDEISKDDFQLYPVYKVKVIMHFRKDVVTIDSALDIEVMDVTEEFQHIQFIKPLMLSEVLAMNGVLPVEAEILGEPENPSVFQSKWIPHLHKGQRLHIHSKASSWKILASAPKGKTQTCYFLISSNYEGCFRRCPRRFSTTSELALSLATTKQMHVVVTKDHESTEGEFPLFSVGDRLEVLRLVKASDLSAVDLLVCDRDNGDEDKEQIQIPLFLEAGFVEDIRDSRKYTLSEVVEYLHLPCEVKVIASDHNTYPLGCVSFLTLEAQITEPFLTVSLAENPNLTFELPPEWLDIPLFFTEGSAKPTPLTRPPTVEELSEAFYYQLLKKLPSNVPAPPRPPKKKNSTHNSLQRPNKGQKAAESSKHYLPSSKVSSVSPQSAELFFPRSKQKSADHDTWNNSNPYTIEYGHQRFQEVTKNPSKNTTGTAFCDNSDHDYEEINEEMNVTIHKMQNATI